MVYIWLQMCFPTVRIQPIIPHEQLPAGNPTSFLPKNPKEEGFRPLRDRTRLNLRDMRNSGTRAHRFSPGSLWRALHGHVHNLHVSAGKPAGRLYGGSGRSSARPFRGPGPVSGVIVDRSEALGVFVLCGRAGMCWLASVGSGREDEILGGLSE